MDTPIVIPPGAAFQDDRGLITNILSDVELRHVAIITSKKGSVRGDHYHPEDFQYIYVISGVYVARFTHVETEEKLSFIVKEGELEYCPPGWAHNYQFLEDTVFLNLTPRNRDADRFEEHTVKYSVV